MRAIQKLTNSLVTVVAQFTAKTTNSEKAPFFHLCLVQEIKSHMLLTCKNFEWKNNFFAPGNWRGDGVPLHLFSTALLYLYYHGALTQLSPVKQNFYRTLQATGSGVSRKRIF